MLLPSEIYDPGHLLTQCKSLPVINVHSSFLFTMPVNLDGLFGLCFIFLPHPTANTKRDNVDIDVQFTEQVKASGDKARLVQHTCHSNQCKHAAAVSSCRLAKKNCCCRRGWEGHTQSIS